MMLLPVYVGITLASLKYATSYCRIPSRTFSSARIAPSITTLNVLPPWSEFATVAAQLSIVTPAVIQMFKFRKQIDDLGSKYDRLESATTKAAAENPDEAIVEGFSKDMKDALAAYKDLYGTMSEQIDSILTNEEIRTSFESDLVESIAELQALSTDVNELRSENKALQMSLDSAAQSQKDSFDNIKKQQLAQAKNLVIAQKMNARERAAMRRDIQKEQNLAIGSVGKTVQALKADIHEISIAGPALGPSTNSEMFNSAMTVDPKSSRNSVAVDVKEFSKLQKKVSSLELTSDSIQKKIEVNYAANLALSDEAIENDKNIFDEINLINNAIYKLEMKNIDTIQELKKDIKSVPLSVEDVMEGNDRKEQIVNLQNDVKNLVKKFSSVEVLEKKSKALLLRGEKNEKMLIDLQNKVEQVDQENVKLMQSIMESPISVELLNGAVAGFADRLTNLEIKNDQIAELQMEDQLKIEELSEGINKIETIERESDTKNKLVSDQIMEISTKQSGLVEKLKSEQKDTRTKIEEVGEYFNQKIELKSKSLSETVAKFNAYEIKNDKELASMKLSIDTVNSEVISSIEKMDEMQTAASEKTRSSLVTLENQMKLQMNMIDAKSQETSAKFDEFDAKSKSKISEIESKLSDSTTRNSMKIQQLSNTLISKLSDVDNQVDGKIKLGVKNEVLENTSQAMIKVSEDMIKLRTEIKQGSEQSEKISGAKMTAFEKQIQLNSRLMVDEVFKSSEFIKGTVELRITDVQKDLRASNDEMREKLQNLDQSVESRAERVIARKSFFFSFRNFFEFLLQLISRFTGGVGNKVRRASRGTLRLFGISKNTKNMPISTTSSSSSIPPSFSSSSVPPSFSAAKNISPLSKSSPPITSKPPLIFPSSSSPPPPSSSSSSPVSPPFKSTQSSPSPFGPMTAFSTATEKSEEYDDLNILQ